LRKLSCWACRLFGAPWLAGKIQVKDLYLPADWALLVEPAVRDGVAVDRDKGSAAPKQKYTYEVVPKATPFSVEILIQNATEAELGLAWLGLAAFAQGRVLLGGARSRGLGTCTLEIDWRHTHWVDNKAALIQDLFPVKTPEEPEITTALGAQGPARMTAWRSTFLHTVGVEV
jgi:CRISPR/Cas system CSM-associated protein Csm3 (group 7 of RAMP superfamily)